MRRQTYDTYEVKEFNESRVEKIVFVSVGNERFDHRPEQIESCNVTIVEFILETDALPQQPQSS